MKIGTLMRNAMAEAAGARLNGGTIQFRTGAQEANPAAAPTGTLCATSTFANPAFGSASTGVITANTIADVTVAASGTVAHFRCVHSGGTPVEQQGTCGLGSGEISFDNNVLVTGGLIHITSLTETMPES